jgi:hypothetical protein
MVKLTVVPVIPLALSEAMKTATLAISASVISRRAWVLLASNSWNRSQVIPDILARASKASLSVPVPGMACARGATTRMPWGASFNGRLLAPGEKKVL